MVSGTIYCENSQASRRVSLSLVALVQALLCEFYNTLMLKREFFTPTLRCWCRASGSPAPSSSCKQAAMFIE